MFSIILSTMFLKQHSVFDVVTGIVMAVFLYLIVYAGSPLFAPVRQRMYQRRMQRGMRMG